MMQLISDKKALLYFYNLDAIRAQLTCIENTIDLLTEVIDSMEPMDLMKSMEGQQFYSYN